MQFLLKFFFGKHKVKNSNIWFSDIRILMALAAACILYFYMNCSYFFCKIVIFKKRRCLLDSFPYAHRRCWSTLLLDNNSCRIAIVRSAIYLVPIVWNLPCPVITVYLDLEEAMALNDCQDHSLAIFENETDAFKLCFQAAYLLNRKRNYVLLIGVTKIKVIDVSV